MTRYDGRLRKSPRDAWIAAAILLVTTIGVTWQLACSRPGVDRGGGFAVVDSGEAGATVTLVGYDAGKVEGY